MTEREKELLDLLRDGLRAVNAAYEENMAEQQGREAAAMRAHNTVTTWRNRVRDELAKAAA